MMDVELHCCESWKQRDLRQSSGIIRSEFGPENIQPNLEAHDRVSIFELLGP